MGDTPANGWIYFKLYVGAAADRFDAFIVHVLSAVLALGPFERWFFLRYADEAGLHLRLRLKPGPTDPDRSLASLQATCRRSLEELPRLSATAYRPMVTGPDTTPPQRGATGLVIAPYEPEWDVFGGPEGMPLAEETFEVSSHVALETLRHEFTGRVSRKTLAPLLMATVSDVLVGADRHRAFWQRYSLHWLGGPTAFARSWRDRFADKSRQLRRQNIAAVPLLEHLPASVQPLAAAWRAQLEHAGRAYRRVTGSGPADGLAFQFAHLMNNRLGLLALEEAYLAALLEDRDAP